MTETPRPTDSTRPTDEIEPMVPRMAREYRADGGHSPSRTGTPEPMPRTDHADPADRHREAIEPMVPDLG